MGCHETGDIMVANPSNFDFVEWNAWMLYNRLAASLDNLQVIQMVGRRLAKMVPGLEMISDRHKTYYHHVLDRRTVRQGNAGLSRAMCCCAPA